MRILVSNPDTIGDMVLRQPFYSALLQHGHELMLIVRDSVVPLVPYVAGGKAYRFADRSVSRRSAFALGGVGRNLSGGAGICAGPVGRRAVSVDAV